MNPLHRMAGRAADRAIGLPSAAAYYEVRPDIAVSRWERTHYHPDAVQHAQQILANAGFCQLKSAMGQPRQHHYSNAGSSAFRERTLAGIPGTAKAFNDLDRHGTLRGAWRP